MKIRNGFMLHPVFVYLLKRSHGARPLTETNQVQNEIAIHYIVSSKRTSSVHFVTFHESIPLKSESPATMAPIIRSTMPSSKYPKMSFKSF